MNHVWMWFCQKVADYYFYRGINKGWNTIEGAKDLDKYNKWIEYKFTFI